MAALIELLTRHDTEYRIMERQRRYTVLKNLDIEQYLNEEDLQTLCRIESQINFRRQQEDRGLLTAVVVESDWPEYEPTWQAIERRVEVESCKHDEWRLAAIAGDGRICKLCGYRDFDYDD